METNTDLDRAHSSIACEDDVTEAALRAELGVLVLDALNSEIRRYLAVVEVFRSEGCEPRWIEVACKPTVRARPDPSAPKCRLGPDAVSVQRV
jgi:hypothetical protein